MERNRRKHLPDYGVWDKRLHLLKMTVLTFLGLHVASDSFLLLESDNADKKCHTTHARSSCTRANTECDAMLFQLGSYNAYGCYR